jgi:hypothetical protein
VEIASRRKIDMTRWVVTGTWLAVVAVGLLVAAGCSGPAPTGVPAKNGDSAAQDKDKADGPKPEPVEPKSDPG